MNSIDQRERNKESNMTEPWKQWEGHTVVSNDDQGAHFRLSQYLGGTQRGAVFLTELGADLQKAAIKLVPADPATSDAQLSRWRRIAELSHPHLLRLFHTGRCRMESTEMLFAVMEYAEEDLSQILPERPLTASETLDMLKPTLEALAYLHRQGFVHGRLKPANIMAVKDQLKLASDGVCQAGAPDANKFSASAYAPPENASGGLSPAADVWSLGMTLTEVLTQQPPSWKETNQEDPVLPPTLPEPFLDIVRHCLRRNPQQRWSITDIAVRLYPASSAPPKPGAINPEAVKERKTSAKWFIVVPAATACFAGALIAGSGILHRQQPAQPRQQAQFGEDSSVTKPDPNPDIPEAAKPSPGAPITSDAGNSQQDSKIIQASLPSSPPAEEIKTATSDPKNASAPKSEGVVQQVTPEVPQKARETIQGKIKVKVRVQVDAPGDVVEAELDSPGPSKYFAQLALQAAQRWKFTPAQSGAAEASREWLLRFEFGSTETRVFPSLVVHDAR
jgi:TonB family protein